MNEKEKKADNKKNTNEIYDFDLLNSCSAMDCTGLIPSSPATEAEYESYKNVYHFQPPEVSAEEDSLKNPVSRFLDHS